MVPRPFAAEIRGKGRPGARGGPLRPPIDEVGGHCCSGSEGHTRPVCHEFPWGGGRPDALVRGRCRGARTPVEGRCSVLTPGLSTLFQRLRSQRGGHRQQDRAGDGELQRCAPPHLPPSPRGCSARGWASCSRVGALPRAGGPSAHGGPHSPFSCQAELLFVCDRREAHWLQPLRSAQGARVVMEGDFGGL